MEAVHTSETSFYFNETARCCIPESCHLHLWICFKLYHISVIGLVGCNALQTFRTKSWKLRQYDDHHDHHDHDHDHVDGVNVRLWTAATNGPFCLSPSWHVRIENHTLMMSTRENSWFVHQSVLWQSYLQSHLVANRKNMGERNYGFYLRNIPFILV
jgi:hypothetical protein